MPSRGRWEFAVTLDRGPAAIPIFRRIARALADDIRRGRLKPGDRLPGTRTLAESLQVNRVTVLAAYDELASEGWIDIVPAQGARVSQHVPDRTSAAAAAPRASVPAPVYELPPPPPVEYSPEMLPNLLVFSGSSPDARLVPIEPLARAYRRVLRRSGGRSLRYSAAEGHPRLRAALAEMLTATRGLAARTEHVFITRGSQMALTLVARALVRPGDVIAVEALGYRHAWEGFRSAGATLVPVGVDANGLDVEALEGLAASRRVRAVYVTPHHQFPTTATLSAQRRTRLLDLARRHRMAIIEDDYDHEFQYAGPPVLPLASLDRVGTVIHIGSLSKVLAPGLRIGYIVGPSDLLAAVAAHREFLDMQGDHVVEAAVAELVEEGEIQRHVRRARREYQRRRDLLVRLLHTQAKERLTFRIPAGGLALWVRAESGVNVEPWRARAYARGVAFQTARSFTFDRKPRPYARLGYGSLDERELTEAVARLVAAL